MGQEGISINHPNAPDYYDFSDGQKTSRAYFRMDGLPEVTPLQAVRIIDYWVDYFTTENPDIEVNYR